MPKAKKALSPPATYTLDGVPIVEAYAYAVGEEYILPPTVLPSTPPMPPSKDGYTAQAAKAQAKAHAKGVPGSGSIIIPLMRNDTSGHPGNDSLTRTSPTMKHLDAGIRSGYRFFQGGKFNDSMNAFRDVLSKIPLVITDNRNDASEMKEMIEICREYITAIRIKGAMAEAGGDPVRLMELSAYFSHCNLQPVHLMLTLRSAMGLAFKFKNFIDAASFAMRLISLLELPDMSSEGNRDLGVKATKVFQYSKQIARNDNTLNYNKYRAFVIDCKDFVPLYTGEECTKCSYCGSSYKGSEMKGKICVTDGFCAVGVETIRLVPGK